MIENVLKKVVIGGGTGFIGSALAKKLKINGYNVITVSRKPAADSMTWGELQANGLPEQCLAVVNLAGQNVLDPTKRWTPGFKQNVYSSRINTTKALANAIRKMKTPPKVFITISGVGYYKPSEEAEYTEDSEGGTHDFLADLAKQWEAAGNLSPELNVRRVIVRSGVVLGRGGGMIKQLYIPFYLGLGGPVATGKQYMPWIHIDDITGIFLHAIESPQITGVLNGVAPQVITNEQFTQTLSRAMWRPAVIPLPLFFLNFAFSPERASIMTEGQRAIPKRTLETGYKYIYPNIYSACKQLVGKTK